MARWKFMGTTGIPGRMRNSWFWTNGEDIAYIDMSDYDEEDIIDVPPRSAIHESVDDYDYKDVVELMDDWCVEEYDLGY